VHERVDARAVTADVVDVRNEPAAGTNGWWRRRRNVEPDVPRRRWSRRRGVLPRQERQADVIRPTSSGRRVPLYQNHAIPAAAAARRIETTIDVTGLSPESVMNESECVVIEPTSPLKIARFAGLFA
jgi:hypothetical protein